MKETPYTWVESRAQYKYKKTMPYNPGMGSEAEPRELSAELQVLYCPVWHNGEMYQIQKLGNQLSQLILSGRPTHSHHSVTLKQNHQLDRTQIRKGNLFTIQL